MSLIRYAPSSAATHRAAGEDLRESARPGAPQRGAQHWAGRRILTVGKSSLLLVKLCK
jgi:hypothetical protein